VFLEAADFIGVQSLPIVAMISLFVGMVFALQLTSSLRQFGTESFVGATLGLALTRELAPVFSSIVVASRAGAGMATELGSMRITEQIDALSTLAVNPVQYLVTPRVLAALIMLPVLTVINDFIGILGGNVIAKFYLGKPSALYWKTVFEQMLSGGFTLHYIPNDFIQGLVKPFVFGGIISLVACHYGLKTTGGTEGVGTSTTRTVVTASILILVVDYFLTQILLSIFQT